MDTFHRGIAFAVCLFFAITKISSLKCTATGNQIVTKLNTLTAVSLSLSASHGPSFGKAGTESPTFNKQSSRVSYFFSHQSFAKKSI